MDCTVGLELEFSVRSLLYTVLFQGGSITSTALKQTEQCSQSTLAAFHCTQLDRTDGRIAFSAMMLWVGRGGLRSLVKCRIRF
jgi:hypothetical protein